MKKLLGIVVLGLLWSNISYSKIIYLKCIYIEDSGSHTIYYEGNKKTHLDISDKEDIIVGLDLKNEKILESPILNERNGTWKKDTIGWGDSGEGRPFQYYTLNRFTAELEYMALYKVNPDQEKSPMADMKKKYQCENIKKKI